MWAACPHRQRESITMEITRNAAGLVIYVSSGAVGMWALRQLAIVERYAERWNAQLVDIAMDDRGWCAVVEYCHG
jgi:hypothetical protein